MKDNSVMEPVRELLASKTVLVNIGMYNRNRDV